MRLRGRFSEGTWKERLLESRDFRCKKDHVPIAREGIPYLVGAMFITLVTAVLGLTFPTLLLLAATLLMGHFFRDPERMTAAGEGEIVSPADGKVIAIKRVESSHFQQRPCMKISIFMSIFDVHVNRIPYSGTVQGVYYKKGRFLAANFTRASGENEQNWLWIKTDAGVDIALTQVAGLIARRIVCWPRPGDRVIRGERFGMIRFGSRVDVYVPEDCQVLVSQGDNVFAGETPLCRLK
ncbi:MAG: phosphatidylserine decarboxylase family protein [Desulfobacteraceae bacterium]|nr:phosphatidylserine decarboxylase family protein [Desulfobacteraceae bacterium]